MPRKQHHVGAPEREGAREDGAYRVHPAGAARHVIEIAFGIGIARGASSAAATPRSHGHHGGDELERARRAQQVAVHRFGGAHRHPVARIRPKTLRMAAVSTASLACGAGAMRVDVADLSGRHRCVLQREAHRPGLPVHRGARDVRRRPWRGRNRRSRAIERAPRALARSRSSSTTMAAPSPRTSPLRSLRERLARCRGIARHPRARACFIASHALQRSRGERRLGAARDHDVALAARDALARFADRHRRRGARGGVGEVGPVSACSSPIHAAAALVIAISTLKGFTRSELLGVQRAVAVVGGLRAAHAGADEDAGAAFRSMPSNAPPDCASASPAATSANWLTRSSMRSLGAGKRCRGVELHGCADARSERALADMSASAGCRSGLRKGTRRTSPRRGRAARPRPAR